MNKDLEKRLKNLNRGVSPREEWQDECREFMDLLAVNMQPIEINDKGFMGWMRIATISLVIFITSFGAVSANQSLPGEKLYPVKKMIEKGESALAESVGSKKTVQQKHLQKRVEELEQVIENKPEDTEKHEMAVAEVNQAVEQTIIDTKTDEAKERKIEEEIVTKVKTVKEKVKSEEVAQELAQVEERLVTQASRSGEVKGVEENEDEEKEEGIEKPDAPERPETDIEKDIKVERPDIPTTQATEEGVTKE